MDYSGSYFKKQTPGWFNTGRQGPGGSEHPGLRLPAPPLPAGAAARRPVPCVPSPALPTTVSVKGQKVLRGGGRAVHGVAFGSHVLASTRHVPVAPPETSHILPNVVLGQNHTKLRASLLGSCVKQAFPCQKRRGYNTRTRASGDVSQALPAEPRAGAAPGAVSFRLGSWLWTSRSLGPGAPR